MAISNIWTLTAGATTKSLSAWGVTEATRTARHLDPDVLSLVFRGDMETPPIAYGTSLVLLRSGVPVWRGKSTTPTPTVTAQGESWSIQGANVWDALDRLIYAPLWKSWSGTALVDSYHPKAILGRQSTVKGLPRTAAERTTAAEDLETLISYAASKGVPCSLGALVGLDTAIPPISGIGQTVGQLIRQIFRWFPDVVTSWDYATTSTLRAWQRVSAPVEVVDVTQTQNLSWTVRDDQVPGNVVLSYELQADADGEDTTSATGTRLQIYQDSYPNDTLDAETLFLALPADSQDPSVQLATQSVTTRLIPEAGAHDTAAERWWLDHTLLGKLGFGTDDVVLPSADNAAQGVWKHQSTLVPVPELDTPPATLGGTPLWNADEISEYPRELVAGALHEWMKVRGRRVECRCTIAVSKTVADALTGAALQDFRSLVPRPTTLSGVAAYLIQARVTVMGTNAKTRVYRKLVAYDGGVPFEPIVGLAQRIYESRTPARIDGRVTIPNREAGDVQYLGRALCVTGGAAEMTSARALVHTETWDLVTGATDLSYGGLGYLAPQDFVELAEMSRLAAARIQATWGAKDQTTASLGGSGGSYGAERMPVNEIATFQQSPRTLWGLEIHDDAGTLKVVLIPGKIAESSAGAPLTIAAVTTLWTPAAGKVLCLKIDLGAPSEVTLDLIDVTSWESYTIVSGAVATIRVPLWLFKATNPTDLAALDAVDLDTLVGVRMAPQSHLAIDFGYLEIDSGEGYASAVVVPWFATDSSLS